MLKVDAYIKGMGCISPQKTFESPGFPDAPTEHSESSYLSCVEPVYKKYIDPMVARRMSRIVKMGIYSAKLCLDEAGINNPDAIITGTGLGCMDDTEKFLIPMLKNNETLLNPSPFIQSTHNTISAQISLFIKCHSYNLTYSHRNLSFESALLDSLLMLKEKSVNTVLLGGVDELTKNYFQITNRLGLWKKEKFNHLKLAESNTKGSLAGEGSVFFLLTDKPNEKDYAKITSLQTIYKPLDDNSLKKETITFLNNNELEIKDIDLVLLGINGDNYFDNLYKGLVENVFINNSCGSFKHLCGEYNTASSFAVWLAALMLKNQSVPDIIKLNNSTIKPLNNILIYNNYRNSNHSFILLQNV